MSKLPLTVAATLVSIFAILAALVFGLVVKGHLDSNTTPVVTAICGLAGIAVPALLGLKVSEQTRQEVRNGLVPQKVVEGINLATQDGTAVLLPAQNTMPADTTEQPTDPTSNDSLKAG